MLETIWFLLWGILWAVYFMLGGFDLGLGALMPFAAKNEAERRVVYNAMGPFWDGNEVWLITAGGVTFAAFPGTYAVMFSALYSPLMLILFALILRGVALEFRSKKETQDWRKLWDFCLVVGSLLPAVLFGVAFANIFSGIPIAENGVWQGSLFGLLKPYGLLGGFFFLFTFLVHGCLWLAIKSKGPLHERAALMAPRLWLAQLILAVVFLAATGFATNLYANYGAEPGLFIIPLLAVGSLLMVRVFIHRAHFWRAWFASCLTIVFTVIFGIVGLYPDMLPSSIDPAHSMTIFNSSSSPLTLKIMLGVALVMVPVVIIYQAWAYTLFRHKVTQEDLDYDEAY